MTPELRRKAQTEMIADLDLHCERPDQFDRFDLRNRASLSVSKETVLKAEARERRVRARRREKKPAGMHRPVTPLSAYRSSYNRANSPPAFPPDR
jgi:hypothetical protein